MGDVIEVCGLRKVYRQWRGGRRVALDGLDLAVPEGGVFGFLGPNGSGKTTTIRCLLGLVAPSGGSARVLGADVTRSLPGVLGRVGAIVEAPALFPSLSGRKNLLLLARVAGIGERAVDHVLERVGLAERGRDLVKTYSLGMRQRLGLAAALLKDPALLILDEPANGLDPAGIREVRRLVRRLGDEGRTVLVSSHILAEVQQTCDHVAIIARGHCVAAGSVAAVLRSRQPGGLLVRLDDLPAGLTALARAGIEADMNAEAIRVRLPVSEAARVSEVLARHRLWITELRPEEASLEDVFLQLTGADVPEEVAA